MIFNKSITTLFALSLSTSAIAETPTTASEKSFFDALSDKELQFAVGSQTNKMDVSDITGGKDWEFTGTYFSASFMPVENFKLSASYFTTETDTILETSIDKLYWQLLKDDGDALLEAYGLNYSFNGLGSTFDENGNLDRYFNDGYFSSTSIEMNEFEIGIAYVANFSSALSYNVYLGYLSGELVTNETLSTKFTYDDDYSPISSTLKEQIKNNAFTSEDTFDDGQPYQRQDYREQFGYLYQNYPGLNPDAHGVSNTVDYTSIVVKIEADFAVNDNFHLLAGLASEVSSIDNVEDDTQDNVYNLGASYTIWNGVGVEFNHKIYEDMTKTSVGINYAF